MLDILFVAWNRLEFTKASFNALVQNTDWSLVNKFVVHDDGSTDGTREWLAGATPQNVDLVFSVNRQEGPVGVMNYYLRDSQAEIFAKIDNDTMVPPGWLNECLHVMTESPELHLLGIEPHSPEDAVGENPGGPPVVPAGRTDLRSFIPARHIGGIGLMRREIFENNLPMHGGRYGGFTHWQYTSPKPVKAGWITPPLPVFLLNRVPFEPWRSLSDSYIEKKWQRDAGRYWIGADYLWSWWRPNDAR